MKKVYALAKSIKGHPLEENVAVILACCPKVFLRSSTEQRYDCHTVCRSSCGVAQQTTQCVIRQLNLVAQCGYYGDYNSI